MKLIIEKEKLGKAKEVFGIQPIMVEVCDKEGNLLENWEIDAILTVVGTGEERLNDQNEEEEMLNQNSESEDMTEIQETNNDENDDKDSNENDNEEGNKGNVNGEIIEYEGNERQRDESLIVINEETEENIEGGNKRSKKRNIDEIESSEVIEGSDSEKNIENSNNRKRSKVEEENDEEVGDDSKWQKEKKRLDKLLKEIKVPSNEIEEEVVLEETDAEIRDTVELYFEAEKGNSESVRRWYRLGESIEIKIKQRMAKDKRLKDERRVKKDIVKEIKDQIVKRRKTNRNVVDSNLRRGLKVYHLFEEIGVEKIMRIRKNVTAVTDITEKGIEYVKMCLTE